MKLLQKSKPINYWPTSKIWKVMKLTTSLIIALTLQVSAAVSSQTVTFSGENVSFKKIKSVIKDQTNYYFFYDTAILKNVKPITINVVNASVDDVLKLALAETAVTWVVQGQTISLIPKTEIEKKSVILLPVQKLVKGIVKNEKGEPIPGANVYVKGSTIAVQTGIDGSFAIEVPEKYTKLVVSYVGMQEEEVVIGNEPLIVVLKIVGEKLEDVVVIGYGTKKRKDLTGAITKLSSDNYKNQPVLNTSDALKGRVAGVSVNNNSGAPGGGIKVRIRGANSVNAGNEPLYVVDGIALTSNGFQQINVYDIKSMEVLKDASATAIYGSRGANGVILITTKAGKSGKTKFDYSTFLSTNSPMKKYDLMDAVSYAKMANLVARAAVFPDPNSFVNKTTDMQDAVFTTALTQNHQLTLSGGNENIKYFISGFLSDQQGILLNTNQEKFGLRSNLTFKLSDRFSLDLNTFVSRINSKNNTDAGYKGNPIMTALTWAPTDPIYDDEEKGLYNVRAVSPSIWSNPYMVLKERNSKSFANVGIFNGKLSYKITDYLTFAANVGLDMNITKYAYVNNQWISPGNMGSGQGYNEAYTFQNSDILTFRKNFNKVHDFTIAAIYENTSYKQSGFDATGTGLTTLINGYNNLALNASQAISSGYSNSGLISYVARGDYAYNNKYLLTATIRRDGSSKFQGDNKWANFPSVGLGWRLSEESFIKNLNTFSNLKLRVGWGVTGNQSIAPYSTLGLMSPLIYSYGTSTSSVGYAIASPASPDLKWETTTQTDFGVDFGLLNNRLNITADYYNKDTKDLLLFTNIPQYSGGGVFLKNIGKVNNKGFELSFDYTTINTEDFIWSIGGNFSSNQNKVVSLGGEQTILRGPNNGLINSPIQAVKEGEALGAFFLIPWAGIHSTSSAAGAPLVYTAGDNHYTDTNGNNSIGDDDKIIAGTATPKYQWGLDNNFTYKDFEMNIFIQAAGGHKMFNTPYAAAALPSADVAYPTLNEVNNYWTPQNTSAVWANQSNVTNRNIIESTQFLQDASYIRVKNISLSYSLPKTIKNISSVKLSISAQNFLTFTKYKGFDPEASSTSENSDADAGIDLGAYPSPKTFTVSLNIGL